MTKNEAINRLIGVAEEEIGYLEKKSNRQLDSKTVNAGSSNYTKYWRDIKPDYQGQPWCACFVSWCFMQAFGLDYAKKLLKHWPYVYCPTLVSLFTKHANPEAGDIVIFYRGGEFAHTGIVRKVSGDKFWAIEGNTSGASGIIPNGGGVCEKTYYNSSLPGTKFCRPDWSILESFEVFTDGKSNASTGKILNKTPKRKAKVTKENLDVRVWGGKGYGRLKSRPTLKKGDVVEVCDYIKDETGKKWFYIRIDGKVYGFAEARYIAKTN